MSAAGTAGHRSVSSRKTEDACPADSQSQADSGAARRGCDGVSRSQSIRPSRFTRFWSERVSLISIRVL